MPEQLISEYRTDVLSLAAFLNLQGHCHQRIEMRGGKGIWVFAANDELNELVNDYHLEIDSVAPRMFTAALTKCRTELFKFLDEQRAQNGK